MFVCVDELSLLLLDGGELFLVKADGLLDHLADVFVDGRAEPIFLLDDHPGDLSFSRGEIEENPAVFRNRLCRSRVHAVGIPGDDAGIDAVGFGELVAGSGEVPDDAWVDDGDGEVVLVQSVDESAFVATGRFETDELWRV